MIGFLVGAAAVAGLIAWKRHGRHCHHHHRHHHRGRWGGWRRHRGMEYWLLAELDCTPAQEKLVREELRGLVEQVRGLRAERDATRDDLARAIAGDQLDRGALMAMFARHDQRLVELRASITASLERVHGTLDPDQRERLAALVKGGMAHRHGYSPGPFGPYR